MADLTLMTAQEAMDPGLDPALMPQIAAQRPDLRTALSLNPSLYPDLRAWLASLGEAAVDRALDLAAWHAQHNAATKE